MEKLVELLEELCTANGVSGDEKDIAAVCMRELEKYAAVRLDTLGNVIGEIDGAGKHILLDAHMDRIGFIVTGIDKSGFLRFASVGANDLRVLPAAEVTVYGKEALLGVITSTPPHLAADKAKEAESIDKLGIDLGLSYEEVTKLVAPGDRIIVNESFKRLQGGRIASPALDDRAGVAAVLLALEKLKNINHGCKITAVFASREEVGGSGAATAAFSAAADEAIAIDVSFATAPGISEPEASVLGGGVIISYAPVLDFDMFNRLKWAAENKNIPYSLEITGRESGSDADEILKSGAGIKTSALFIPLRNMHSAVELADLLDIERTAELIAQYIIEMGGEI